MTFVFWIEDINRTMMLQGTLLSVIWQPGWEGSLGEIGYMYIYGWAPLLLTWNYHSIVNWLYSNRRKKKCDALKGAQLKVTSLSHVWLFATPWTVAYWAPPSMGFSGQGYWSGLPFPQPQHLTAALEFPHIHSFIHLRILKLEPSYVWSSNLAFAEAPVWETNRTISSMSPSKDQRMAPSTPSWWSVRHELGKTFQQRCCSCFGCHHLLTEHVQ